MTTASVQNESIVYIYNIFVVLCKNISQRKPYQIYVNGNGTAEEEIKGKVL